MDLINNDGFDEKIKFIPTQKLVTRFEDIAGMEKLKRKIHQQIVGPFLNPGLFAKFKRKAGGGILLYGPPGCGKTMFARAIASEINAKFFSVSISDIRSALYGESEKNIAAIFETARSHRPAVIFFDELDALAYSRSKSRDENNRVIVNELLSQLDGVESSNEGIMFLAATNMPWDIDDAIKRPGRFSRMLFVPPPDLEARKRILELCMSDIPSSIKDFTPLAKKLEGFSGADISGLVEEAKDIVLSNILAKSQERPLSIGDLVEALDEVNSSIEPWMETARNLVKFSGKNKAYKDMDKYLS